MLVRLATTITIVIICLAAMSITAYAYFSANITSGSNTIKAANFEANVLITITGSKSNPVTVTKDGKVQTANLEAGKYTIKLTRGNCTAHKGFGIITIADKNQYTDQIGVDIEKNKDDASVEFELWLSTPTKIEVLSHWGTSVYYGYKDSNRTEVFIVSGSTLDLTTEAPSDDVGDSEDLIGQSVNTTTTSMTSTTMRMELSGTTLPAMETTTPSATVITSLVSSETTRPVQTSPSAITQSSGPTGTMEPTATPQSSAPTGSDEPLDTTESMVTTQAQPVQTTPPATTQSSGSTGTTEPTTSPKTSESTEPSESSGTTKPMTTTETQLVSETTSATSIEANSE